MSKRKRQEEVKQREEGGSKRAHVDATDSWSTSDSTELRCFACQRAVNATATRRGDRVFCDPACLAHSLARCDECGMADARREQCGTLPGVRTCYRGHSWYVCAVHGGLRCRGQTCRCLVDHEVAPTLDELWRAFLRQKIGAQQQLDVILAHHAQTATWLSAQLYQHRAETALAAVLQHVQSLLRAEKLFAAGEAMAIGRHMVRRLFPRFDATRVRFTTAELLDFAGRRLPALTLEQQLRGHLRLSSPAKTLESFTIDYMNEERARCGTLAPPRSSWFYASLQAREAKSECVFPTTCWKAESSDEDVVMLSS